MDNLISTWHSNCETGFAASIIPDGCRDLILKTSKNEPAQWFIPPLFDQAISIYIEDNTRHVGFRFKPGVEIKAAELLNHIKSTSPYPDEVQNILDDFTNLDSAIEEALACLASGVKSIKQASTQLGVSSRTLQRLVSNKTAKTPNYWLQLARARKAARDMNPGIPLADLAERHGFADQSHMNREFQRWFKATPTEILKSPWITEQLSDIAYS